LKTWMTSCLTIYSNAGHKVLALDPRVPKEASSEKDILAFVDAQVKKASKKRVRAYANEIFSSTDARRAGIFLEVFLDKMKSYNLSWKDVFPEQGENPDWVIGLDFNGKVQKKFHSFGEKPTLYYSKTEWQNNDGPIEIALRKAIKQIPYGRKIFPT
jgi:hypothetical protein